MLGVKVKMEDGIAETPDRDYRGKWYFYDLRKGHPWTAGDAQVGKLEELEWAGNTSRRGGAYSGGPARL
jgi:hypothetical protein